VVRRGSRDLLYIGEVSAEAKAVYSVHLGKAVPSGPSKTSERAQSAQKRKQRRKKLRKPLTATFQTPQSF
ncbi:MAG: hypothetical protein J6W10_01485, partial [Kiritimatiellae bacterium]|nr:hypothetical protein [Kiritimatiellia bacterium]